MWQRLRALWSRSAPNSICSSHLAGCAKPFRKLARWESHPVVDPQRLSLEIGQPSLTSFALELSLDADLVLLASRTISVSTRQAQLWHEPPWSRSLGKLTLELTTQGWKF